MIGGLERPRLDAPAPSRTAAGLTVVKIGADPAEWDSLSEWLELLAAPDGCPAVLVPGGGAFLTAVREVQDSWRVPEEVAHRMALLAMEQHGLMLHGLCPSLLLADGLDGLLNAARAGRPAVWLPARTVAERPALARQWAMGTDSLAVWLAAELGAARLALVGSGEGSGSPADPLALAREGLVDMAFPVWSHRFSGEIWRVHRDDIALMAALIAGCEARRGA
ncbi:uridylate kinase [Azospirillum sp. SYSU D00513]|uniref:uridylate kinase n=1 Tax=Azospirillum sp. SYSU D00513 TaxID=2812561 RepID=UPI001A97309C|nr:uridylate kinase [Azospirillum sp. SYSU D00513]